MAQVRVTHSIGRLAADMADIPARAAREERGIVKRRLAAGNRRAAGYAKVSAGEHGKHYHKAFSTEMHGALSTLSGGRLVSGEYGPDAAMPQGDMSFEHGSKNQKPHLDLARSADLDGPELENDVDDMVGRLFLEAGFR